MLDTTATRSFAPFYPGVTAVDQSGGVGRNIILGGLRERIAGLCQALILIRSVPVLLDDLYLDLTEPGGHLPSWQTAAKGVRWAMGNKGGMNGGRKECYHSS